MKLFVKLLFVAALLATACEKNKSQNSTPPEGFSYIFEIVDSTGEALADTIADLPFDTQLAYFENTRGDRFPLRFHPPRWSAMNPTWTYDSSGSPVPGMPDSIGVAVEVDVNSEQYDAYEGELNQFTWYIYLDPKTPPDTFTVYNSGFGSTADSAKINGLLIPPKESRLLNGRLIPRSGGSRLVLHFPIFYPYKSGDA